ncbi:MAG: molybdopterin-binding protein [Pseudomonadota bacterium]
MRFGPMSLNAAQGGVLAHSLIAGGARLRKGTVLTEEDVAVLAAAGIDKVIVAMLDPGDVDENQAAERLAKALVPDPEAAHLRVAPASTGRVNIYADQPGLLEIDAGKIHAANAISPMITIATPPPWQRLGLRGMAATVKIISYAVPGPDIEVAAKAARAVLSLRPPVYDTAGFIQTVLAPGEAPAQKTTQDRLARLAVSLEAPVLVQHEVRALSDAIQAQVADVIFILTASATSDIQDTAPAALVRAGGEVVAFGMPVDPGNLLFYGRLGAKHVIGLPGCARSPALNGADWILERVLCGVEVTQADIAGMGVGGLLKEIPSRPRPREG